MKARTFDRKFDRGEDITEHLDLSSAWRPPAWLTSELTWIFRVG